MRTRPGFARLLPLIALTGLAAGTIALLANARHVRVEAREARVRLNLAQIRAALSLYMNSPMSLDDLTTGSIPIPRPCSDIRDADGRRWELADIPGHTLRGLDLRGAEWAGVVLHGATFVDCDFRDCDLRNADLR